MICGDLWFDTLLSASGIESNTRLEICFACDLRVHESCRRYWSTINLWVKDKWSDFYWLKLSISIMV